VHPQGDEAVGNIFSLNFFLAFLNVIG
jgi:hypothetical protein